MDERNLDGWSQFEEWIAEVDTIRAELRKESPHGGYVSTPVYRGHANHTWKLETSLERYHPAPMRIGTYARLANATKPSVETLTDKRWEFPDSPSIDELDGTMPPILNDMFKGEAYEFLLNLRHNGFPSPLLDWSASPYVAAFFAFTGSHEDAEYVSVYSYIEYAGRAKGGWAGQPNIFELGPYTRAHRRHFMQQSRYTICTKKGDNGIYFASHEDAFGRNDQDQDRLWKVNIPTKDRRMALRILDLHNINAYSLFGSDEGLMQMLAFRHFDDFIGRELLTDPDQQATG